MVMLVWMGWVAIRLALPAYTLIPGEAMPGWQGESRTVLLMIRTLVLGLPSHLQGVTVCQCWYAVRSPLHALQHDGTSSKAAEPAALNCAAVSDGSR